MRIKMNIAALAAILVLFGAAMCSPAAHAQTLDESEQPTYEQQKTEVIKKFKYVVHVMISGPATKDTIELKDTILALQQIEYDYARARASGASAETLGALGRQYLNALVTLNDLHARLYDRVDRATVQAENAWRTLQQEHEDQVTQDMPLFQEHIDAARNALKPLAIGAQRLDEVLKELQMAVQARHAADPKLVINDQIVNDEIPAAVLRILDRRSRNSKE